MGDEHRCGVWQQQLVPHTGCRAELGARAAETLKSRKLTRGIGCPCVWWSCIKDEGVCGHCARRRRHDWRRAIGRGMSRQDGSKNIQDQDSGLEIRGRILNRVIECERGGITIEAEKRRVRELLKDLRFEQANPVTTPCVVVRTRA